MQELILSMAMLAFSAAPMADLSCKREPATPRVIELKARKANPGVVKRLEAGNLQADETQFVGIGGECHVDSRVNVSVKVYINGRYRGTIAPGGDIYPIVGDFPEEITDLYAVSTCGRFSWSRRVSGNVASLHWVLRP